METTQSTEVESGPSVRTFLIADIRGYTVFTAERGDEAAAQLAARFATAAREVVAAHGGQVPELRGDEALAVFESVRQAIRAAVALQRRFVDETVADPTLPMPVGIGIDAGEAVAVEDGYRGGALNLAARLCAMAAPAEILASREVVHLARKVDGVAVVERGAFSLKGLAEPVQVVRLRAEADDPAEDLAFRRALGPAAARLTPAVPGAMPANPYKGLRAFEEADAADFFGRDRLIAQLLERLGESRFLAVVGPSGSGKSSVVRAGLLPALRRRALPGSDDWRMAEMFPGAHPLEQLEAALLRVAENPPSSLLEQLERDDRGLARAAARILPAGGDAELLLVIDQFEEVFTLVADEAARVHFLESIQAAVTDPHTRLRVVVTLRADFYDRPLRYRGFAELLQSRVEAVVPLSPEELERVIAGPAKRVGARLEDGLVARMMADVGDQPGGLPLLEYALTELFEQREGNVLTLERYDVIGGVPGALGRRAEELYAGLDDEGREACRQVFLRLVSLGEGTEDTRRPVHRAELPGIDAPVTAAMLDPFGASRLLSFDRDSRSGEPTIEVAHEALLTAWRRLRRWIDDAREDLRVERRLGLAAQEWVQSGREQSFLASGSRLEQFDAWRNDAGLASTAEENEFLDASLAERDRALAEEETRAARERALERRSLRRMRALVAVLAVAGLIAGALTLFAFGQQGRAERESRVALARELAAASVSNLAVDSDRSILLALEAVDTTRGTDESVLPEAEEALHRAVGASRAVLRVPGLGGWVDWSPAGDMFVTEGPENTGTIDIRDPETGESLRSWHGHDVDVNGVAFSADGSMLATTGDDGAVRVWDPRTGEMLGELDGPDAPVLGPSFSPDGSLVAATWIFDDAARIWNWRTGEITATIDVPGAFATAFSPDGGRLAVATEDARALVIEVASGAEVYSAGGQEFEVTDVDWSPDGMWLATSSGDGTVAIRAADTGDTEFFLAHDAAVTNVDWSADSRRLVTGGSDGLVKIWDISKDGGRELMALAAQDTAPGITGVAYSPDGGRVLTGDIEITAARIWDVSIAGDAEWTNVPSGDVFNSVAFTAGGDLLAETPGGAIRVWDAETGRRIRDLDRSGPPPDREIVDDIEPSPDGRLMAAVVDGGVQVSEVATGREPFTVRSDGFATDASWSPDGRLLAIAVPDSGRTLIFDRTGKELTHLEEGGRLGPSAVTFSPDGRLLATAVWPIGRPDPTGERIRIWDWKSGTIIRTIDAPAEALAFDPRGDRLAVAGRDGGEILSAATGDVVTTLAGGAEGLGDIDFSPDGTLVAGGGPDGTVRLWDAATGVRMLELDHGEPVTDVAFSADGRKLASAGAGGMIRVWALDLDDLVRIARGELTRELTPGECRQFLHGPCPASTQS